MSTDHATFILVETVLLTAGPLITIAVVGSSFFGVLDSIVPELATFVSAPDHNVFMVALRFPSAWSALIAISLSSEGYLSGVRSYRCGSRLHRTRLRN